MELLPRELAVTIPAMYSQEAKDPSEVAVPVKYFFPAGRGTWYVVEAEAVLKDGSCRPLAEVTETDEVEDVIFFGFVRSPLGPDLDEMGNFSLREMESVKGLWGLRMERDLHWDPTTTLDKVVQRGPGYHD